MFVATVLTVYGIETISSNQYLAADMLQQYLPFTVLKRSLCLRECSRYTRLQQYLPFTVLKLLHIHHFYSIYIHVATVLTVYGIETPFANSVSIANTGCNSTYRLRY